MIWLAAAVLFLLFCAWADGFNKRALERRQRAKEIIAEREQSSHMGYGPAGLLINPGAGPGKEIKRK